jgi:hypothetical protein
MRSSEGMLEKIISTLNGDQYQDGQTWDTLDTWADVADLYHSLSDSLARAEFEHEIVGLLYNEVPGLRHFAMMMCYELQIRSSIPWLLSFIETSPEDRRVGLACLALGAMRVAEAASFLESRGFVYDLFRVDYRRSIPLIQRLIRNTCEGGYHRLEARQGSRPPLPELTSIFSDLYTRFGTKGVLLLLEELNVEDEHQLNFILDAVSAVASDWMERKRMEMTKWEKQPWEQFEVERKAFVSNVVSDVERWLRTRLSE